MTAQLFRRYRLLPVYFRKICIKLARENVLKGRAAYCCQPFMCSKSLYSTEGGIKMKQVLHYRFLTHWHDRFDEKSYLEEKGQGPKVNKVPCLLTRWLLPFNLPVYFLTQGNSFAPDDIKSSTVIN
ncbi:hypothetical protein DAPPUDRAFT_100791 [Daphnia pulex]|uniref:Uncharacterized protein n=1 Tax=Daphnia pulex TaxID=6669 RepID=E9GBB1_DAPPU|nr:hypothetical protein DAPPUDRAFT_100791 [Daphnia pulex]|eukprot:EFX83193.1 hypothetical protein DAPPUDRAFT_100791 [Daphnia pulex]